MEIIHVRFKTRSKYNEEEDKKFRSIRHVAAACEKNKEYGMRESLRYIFSDGKFLYGTDSISLHVSEFELKKGLFKVLGTTPGETILHYEGEEIENIKYPNVEIVVSPLLKKIKHVKPIEVNINMNERSVTTACKISRYISEEKAFNFDLLKKFQRGKYEAYDINEGLNPLYFKEIGDFKNLSALIMPIKMK